MIVTIFENIYSKQPRYISVKDALERIRLGKSKIRIADVRSAISKKKADSIKIYLPSVCFSGKFKADRQDVDLIEHSGFMVLDFDEIDNLRDKQEEIINHNFIYACWVSPRGNGLKALVKIADGKHHREHFAALQEIFPELDKSGVNVSRVCFESYDESIYINENSEIFKKIKKTEKIIVNEKANSNDYDNFKKILVWLSNRNDAFVTGERNTYIFKLASACCRFGIDENTALGFISNEYSVNNDFTMNEMRNAVKSGYKRSAGRYGTASFERERLVDKTSRIEINVKQEFVYVDDENYKVEDVVYGDEVRDKAMSIYDNGFATVEGIGLTELDYHFKARRQELTLLTGIGNYGKSAFKKWFFLARILLFGEKIATFSPEDTPPEEYFYDYVEMILGCDCSPRNPNRPPKHVYEYTYDFISKHLFYIKSEMLSPTPEYIKQKFLELIIQEKVDICCIDPFNQMTNDYKGFGGRTDKYLETLLSDFSLFAQKNDIFFWIIAHPKMMDKINQGTLVGNYKCPDVFDINDGAMWNNKMWNILVYHRPFAQTQPQHPLAEIHSKKIKKKQVGKRGFFELNYEWNKRRFIVNGKDIIEDIFKRKKYDFMNDWKGKQTELNLELPPTNGLTEEQLSVFD